MGYGLPAAIGVCIGSGKRSDLCEREGCMQMNLQELQTIRHHNLPIRIFVINNEDIIPSARRRRLISAVIW